MTLFNENFILFFAICIFTCPSLSSIIFFISVIVTFNRVLSRSTNICLFIVIALGFNWAYYLFYPKSTYMLNHLSSQNQVRAWLKIYKEMKLRCHLGLVLGVIGYIILGIGWC